MADTEEKLDAAAAEDDGEGDPVSCAAGDGPGLLLAVATFTGLAIREQVDEQQKATHAAGLVQRLLDAETAQVPGIVGEMAEYRKWTDPLLRAGSSARRQIKLPAETPRQPRPLARGRHAGRLPSGRLLDAEPHEVPVIRDALAPHKDALLDEAVGAWWRSQEKGKESQRLRAAAALAKYDPEARVGTARARWWSMTSFWKTRSSWASGARLSSGTEAASCTVVRHLPRSPTGARAERSLATNFLADYVADQPQVLADLLMDADEKQFPVIYPNSRNKVSEACPC